MAIFSLGLAVAAVAATYEYDALGRLTYVVHDDGSTVTYSYDANGNRTQVVITGSAEFSVNNASVVEGGNLVFTVTRTGVTSLSHSVDYATAPGTASASDFTGVSGTLTFAPSETAKTVTVATVQDAIFEADETVFLNLSGATGGATISVGQGVGTITNDDPAPAFSVNSVSVAEGGNLVFTVTKSGATAFSHSVNYATANGTATAGSDYTATSGTLTFTAGETTKTVTVLTIQDVAYEDDETLFLNLSSATNGAIISVSQGIGTILNDDAPPTFAINNVSVVEGGNLVFTVTKAGPAAQAYEIAYATANGTATAPADYIAASGSVIFGIAETTKTITVATVQDAIFEAAETVLVNLTPVTPGTVISTSQGVGTITNDDPAPAFSVNNVSVAEGGNLVFTVTKSGATAFSHNVNYATANGTATAGSDYTARSGTLTFTAAQTTQTVTVPTTHDTVYEANETLFLNLSTATNGATISTSQGVGTITNNDPAPAFSVNNVSVAEGGNLVFTVTKSGATALSHNVNYATANGTATAGSDYTARSGTLTFTAAQTTQTVTVPTTHDTVYEANETLFLNLSAATNGATISTSQGVGTITNNDPAPAFSVNNVSVAEGGNLVFTVTKSGATAFSHNVNYATANGTATAGSDYTARSGTLTFTAAQTTQTVTVPTTHDTVWEPNETLFLNLSAATNGATISVSQGVGTILNNDPPSPPTAQITNPNITAGPYQEGYIHYMTVSAQITATDPHGGTTTLHVTTQPGSTYTTSIIVEYGRVGSSYYVPWDPQPYFYWHIPRYINISSSTGASSTYVLHSNNGSPTLTLVP